MMTVLSELINDFKLDTNGVDLYHGKYRYKAVVKFRSINRVRYYSSVEKFLTRLENKTQGIDIEALILRDGGTIGDLCAFIEWRNLHGSKNYKSMICGNYLTFYFNDVSNLQSFFDTFEFPVTGYYREQILNHQKGVVYLKSSKHLWRVYLNNHKLTIEENAVLNNLFQNYGIKPCPMLLKTVSKTGGWPNRGGWIYYTNFFDIPDDATLTIVGLHVPQLIRKICSIVLH